MVAKKKAAPAELPLDQPPQGGAGVASEFEQQIADEVSRFPAAADHGDKAPPAEPPAEPTKAKGWGKKNKPAAAPTGAADETVNLSNVKKSLLHGVERIERLMEERGAISEDIKEVFAELRGAGYNTKIIREVMKRRGWGEAAIKEHDSLIDLYEEALR